MTRSPALRRCPKSESPPDISKAAQAIGRSRGGLTTKITVLSDSSGRISRLVLRPGNSVELRDAFPLLDAAPKTPGALLADKAYDAAELRGHLAAESIEAVIPPRSNHVNPPQCDMNAYKARHLVENLFADLKQFRGVATRYCKLASTFESMASLCCWTIGTRKTRRGRSPHL